MADERTVCSSPHKNERILKFGLAAIAFAAILPSRGRGVSPDELVQLAVLVAVCLVVLAKAPAAFLSPAVAFGGVACLGASGMLLHDSVSVFLNTVFRVAVFIAGIAISAAIPPEDRRWSLGILATASLAGGVLVSYLDWIGWRPELDPTLAPDTWEIGVRGNLTSLSPYWTIAVTLTIAYARQWSRGVYAVALVMLPVGLTAVAGVGQGRGAALITLLGAALILAPRIGVGLVLGAGVVGTSIYMIISMRGVLPPIFDAFLDRVNGTEVDNIDRLEHASISFRLLGDGSLREWLLGNGLARVNSALGSDVGVHNGYLEPLVTGGLAFAIPLWLMFFHLATRVVDRSVRLDDASRASRVTIVQVLLSMAAASILWDWHGALYFGLAVGFACRREGRAGDASTCREPQGPEAWRGAGIVPATKVEISKTPRSISQI